MTLKDRYQERIDQYFSRPEYYSLRKSIAGEIYKLSVGYSIPYEAFSFFKEKETGKIAIFVALRLPYNGELRKTFMGVSTIGGNKDTLVNVMMYLRRRLLDALSRGEVIFERDNSQNFKIESERHREMKFVRIDKWKGYSPILDIDSEIMERKKAVDFQFINRTL